ncbi:hypothetical protein [Streptomyces albidoflavus]|uniref:hypothetical protein n=1 Tax=Streptomyces albidoflavus TaxID=1886 RepID=UPI0033FD2219
MSEPDETTVMGWAEHDAHDDDYDYDLDEHDEVPQDPPEDGWEFFYDENAVRNVLAESFYNELVESLGQSVPGNRIAPADRQEVVDSILARVGLLPPPPEPEADFCGALWPDADGVWHQCQGSTEHEAADGHGGGGYDWTDGSPNAIRRLEYSTEPPF